MTVTGPANELVAGTGAMLDDAPVDALFDGVVMVPC